MPRLDKVSAIFGPTPLMFCIGCFFSLPSGINYVEDYFLTIIPSTSIKESNGSLAT